jgi:hypothetical protein
MDKDANEFIQLKGVKFYLGWLQMVVKESLHTMSRLVPTIQTIEFIHVDQMIGKNRQLVIDEPVEFEKQPVEVQDCRKIIDHLRGIYRIYPNLMKENQRMSACNRLDLQTLGSQPIMPKNLPIPDLNQGHF